MNLSVRDNNSPQDILARFREFLNSKGYSTPTVKNYLSDLRHLIVWISNSYKEFRVSLITEKSLRAYKADLKFHFRAKPAIAARRLSSLRTFIAWAEQEGLLTRDLLKALSPILRDVDDSKAVSQFRNFLKIKRYSIPTIKNYISDLRHLIVWIETNYEKFQFSLITENSVRSYRSFLKEKFRSKPSIAARRLSSLRKFLFWAQKNGLVTEDLLKTLQKVLEEPIEKPVAPIAVPPTPIQIVAPTLPTTPPPPIDLSKYKIHQKVIHHIKNTRPAWYRRYHNIDLSNTLHITILVIFLVVACSIVAYTQFFKPDVEETKYKLSELGDILAAASPPRILSFQGRLTNASGVPVVDPVNIVFRIYTSTSGDTGSPCANTCKWESKTWSVDPDQNGIFSVQLGDTDQGDTIIPDTLFSENATLYLGVKVGSDPEMTPRQRIASVSYALNSDALEGFHGSQTPGAKQVPILNDDGNLIFIGAATIGSGGSGALTLDSASGTLTLGAGTNTIVNTDGSTALLINPTGDLRFFSVSNYITSAGNLTLAGTLTVNGASGTIGSEGNTFTFSTSSGPTYSGTARISKTVTLQPEYPGASLSVDDGTNNTGAMTSDVDTSNWRNYYEWSSSEAALNDYSVIVRFTLPADFSAWEASNAILIRYITEAVGTADNAVSARINNEDDTPGTPVVTKSDVASTSWAVITIDDSEIDDGGAPDWDLAGERAAIRIKLKSRNNNYARVGDIVLNYLAKF